MRHHADTGASMESLDSGPECTGRSRLRLVKENQNA